MRRTDRGSRVGGLVAFLVAASAGLGLSPASASAAGEDSWDAIFAGGAKIGHVHTYLEPVKDKGRELIRVRVDTEMTFKRLNDEITVQLQYGTIETADGEVLRLDTRTVASDNVIRAFGDVSDGKMTLKLKVGDKTEQKTIPWDKDVRGPYAAEQSLARKMMVTGETRTLKMYMPELNRVCDITLTAGKNEEVELGGGTKRPVLRIEQKTTLDGKPRPEFNVTLFADSGGQVLKSQMDMMGGIITYRTTREGALGGKTAGLGQFDQIRNSVIRIDPPISNPTETRALRYKVALKDGAIADVLPSDRRQTLTAGAAPNEATLDVKTAGPNDGLAGDENVDPSYLRPNPIISSDDRRVVELTRRATGNATSAWDKASRINKWVHSNVTEKNFKTAFAPAFEVAANLSGDCTEHGVLTAAMLRAAGIPSRVVIGLVYVRDLNGFGYHAWTEAYINRRWVALDPTFDENAVDAAHIKLSDSSLDGVSPFESFLPLMRVLGKLSIERVEVQ